MKHFYYIPFYYIPWQKLQNITTIFFSNQKFKYLLKWHNSKLSANFKNHKRNQTFKKYKSIQSQCNTLNFFLNFWKLAWILIEVSCLNYFANTQNRCYKCGVSLLTQWHNYRFTVHIHALPFTIVWPTCLMHLIQIV